MALNRLKSGYISNTTHDGGNAANAAVIGYSTANNRVEFIEATVDTSALDTISANVSNYSAQLTANINTIAANADTLVVGVDAAEASLDGVSDNIDSFAAYANSTFVSDGIAANTFVTIETNTLTEEGFSGNVTANVSSDVLTFTAGNGVAFLANAESQSITLAAKLSEIAHDRFTADGTANTFTLSREAAAADELIVYVDGVLQVPANNYTVSSTTLTLANVLPLINGTLVDVRHLPVSGSEGELEIVAPYSFQGSIALYQFGSGNKSGQNQDDIRRVSVTSDADSTDLGEFSFELYGSTNHSNEAGYQLNGRSGSNSKAKKFNFASETTGTEVSSSLLYSWAGGASTAGYGYFVNYTDNRKFPFASITPVITTGSLPSDRQGGSPAVNASLTHGYYSGGAAGSPSNHIDVIVKYPFASDTDATDVAELTNNRKMNAGGSSSETHGYVMGGEGNINYSVNVEKFPFASDTPSSNIISSGFARRGAAGSSTTHGYLLGGRPGNYDSSNIKKHSFTNDSEVTTVGSLPRVSTGYSGKSVHCANN